MNIIFTAKFPKHGDDQYWQDLSDCSCDYFAKCDEHHLFSKSPIVKKMITIVSDRVGNFSQIAMNSMNTSKQLDSDQDLHFLQIMTNGITFSAIVRQLDNDRDWQFSEMGEGAHGQLDKDQNLHFCKL